jgi:AraC family transcriptional regulator
MHSLSQGFQRLPAGTYFGVSKKAAHIGSVDLVESSYPQGTHLPPHVHERPHLVFVLAGSYEELFEHERFERKAGQLLFLPADMPHTEHHFLFGWHFMIEPPEGWWQALEPHVDLRRPADVTRGPGVKLTMALHREFRDPDEFSGLKVDALVLDLLASLGRDGVPRRSDRPEPPFLRIARAFLSERFAEPMSLTRVARHIGVHPVTLARSFKRHYRTSVRDSLHEHRVRFACQQLLQTEDTIATIALAAGFFDHSHLSNAFKKTTGMTPAQFRRQAARATAVSTRTS